VQWYEIFQACITQLAILQVIAPALLLLFIEEAGVMLMIPGDVILSYMGYQVANSLGGLMWVAVLITTGVVCLGASILFWIGRRWGGRAVKKLGAYMFISQKRMDQSERLFKRYGFWAVLVGRHIPGLRLPITVYAGSSGMSYWQFLASTIVSVVPWIILFMYLGHFVGRHVHVRLHIAPLVTLLVICGLMLLVIGVHIYRARKHPQ
jgi:membrane protein DedA with SNARE-associated domain